MAKVQSTTAEAIAPWLDDVQHVSVESIETRTTIEWPSSLGINIEATALGASTYRGDQVVIERLAKFSANGSLAARFMFAGEPSIDALPTPSDWMAQSGITLRGGAHTAIAFAQSGGASFIRSGPRLLQIGYDTYGSSFPVSVEFPGGTRITEGGALGIGVGVPASALHVSSAGDQLRVEYPGGGFLGIEVGPFGNAQFSTTGGQSTFAGVLKTDTLNAGDVNVAHLHAAVTVTDKTALMTGAQVWADVGTFVMQSVNGVDGSADVEIVVAERVAEAGTQLFDNGDTVTVYWVDRVAGVDHENLLSGTVIYGSRDPTTFPARQTYVLTPVEYNDDNTPPWAAFEIPSRAVVYRGKKGMFSMLNGAARVEMPGTALGWLTSAETLEGGSLADNTGLYSRSTRGVIVMTEDHGAINIGSPDAFGNSGDFGLCAHHQTVSFPVFSFFVGQRDGRAIVGEWTTAGGGMQSLEVDASSLKVDGTAVTLSSVVPNTAPAAGQILVGNAGGTAFAPVTMSGDATLASTGALTIAASAVSLGKMADMATASLLGRNTAGTGAPEVLSASTVRTMLSINNVENTALSTWAGSSNITTHGTIAGTDIAFNPSATLTLASATGVKIRGNWGDATLANRTIFQSGSDTFTSIAILGGGATRAANVAVIYGNDASNANYGTFAANSTGIVINSTKVGTGTTQPLQFQTNSTTAMTIDTSNQIGMGVTPLANCRLYVYRTATDPAATQYGQRVLVAKSSTSADSSLMLGLSLALYTDGAGTHSGASYGAYLQAYHNAATSGGSQIGLHAEAGVSVSGGTSALAISLQAGATGSTGATVTTRYGLNVAALDSTTVNTSLYAIAIQAQTNASGTTKYGLYIGNISGATTNYALYTSTGAVRFGDHVTLADKDLIFGTTTGTKIGTATTQKLGLWGVTPVVQPASANQAAVSATAATQTTPWGFASQAQADGIVTLLNEIRSALVTIGAIKGAA